MLLGLCACWYFRRQTPQPSSQTPGAPGDVRQHASSADGNGPSTSSSSRQDSRPLECSDLREGTARVRAPFVFNGDADMLREWVFVVEMAMKMQALRTPSQMVDFAAMLLSGNACLWLLKAKDTGETFPDWPTFRAALTDVFGPLHEQEQARLRLISVTQESSLDEYINLFSRLSLLLPEVDDHTRALLFVRGLKTDIRSRTLAHHPHNLSEAIRAARMSDLTPSMEERREPAFQPGRRYSDADTLYGKRGARPRRLSEEDRARLAREKRCFACRKQGHMARDCTQSPNAGRQ